MSRTALVDALIAVDGPSNVAATEILADGDRRAVVSSPRAAGRRAGT